MAPTSEFTHIVTTEPWPAEGIAVDLAATDDECRRLKERFDLVEVKSLKALGKVEQADDGFLLTGRIEAEVTQSCVVSLAPVPAVVKTSFQRRFVRNAPGVTASELDETTLNGDDADIDVLESDDIDVGDVVAEEFGLALEPYPRAKDADVVMAEVQGILDQDNRPLSDSPFAKLRRH